MRHFIFLLIAATALLLGLACLQSSAPPNPSTITPKPTSTTTLATIDPSTGAWIYSTAAPTKRTAAPTKRLSKNKRPSKNPVATERAAHPTKRPSQSQAISKVKNYLRGKTSITNENCLEYVNRLNSVNYWYALWKDPVSGWKGHWEVGALVGGGYSYWYVYEDGKVHSDQVFSGC